MPLVRLSLAILALLAVATLSAPTSAAGLVLPDGAPSLSAPKPSPAPEGGNADTLAQFFTDLYGGLQVVGIAIGVLMAGWAAIKIMTGQRDGIEKLVLAGAGVFVLVMAKPLIDLVEAATK